MFVWASINTTQALNHPRSSITIVILWVLELLQQTSPPTISHRLLLLPLDAQNVEKVLITCLSYTNTYWPVHLLVIKRDIHLKKTQYPSNRQCSLRMAWWLLLGLERTPSDEWVSLKDSISMLRLAKCPPIN